MAVVFCDGCDSYSVTADIAKKWAIVGAGWSYQATAGRNGGGALQVTTATSLVSASGLFAATEMCIGFWFKASATPSAAATFFTNIDAGGSAPGFGLWSLTTAGLLRVNVGAGFLTGATNICDNAWHWIEWDIEQAGSAATAILYIDTIQQFSTLTTTTAALTIDHFQFVGLTGITITLDDILCYNNTAGGPVFSSLPLGPRQISTLRPDADNTQTFARSAGSTNYSLVNEVASDGDTTYVQSGTSGDQDLYEYATFAVDPATINAVMVNSVLVNPNPGTINFQTACKSSATTTLGTSTIAPAAYATKQQQYATDPNTGSAWTPNNLAAAQFGIKVA